MARTIDKGVLTPTAAARVFGDAGGVTCNFELPALLKHVRGEVNVLSAIPAAQHAAIAAGTSTYSIASAVQGILDASGVTGVVYPGGTYYLADGEALTLRSNQSHRGSGRQKTFLSSRNAYAMQTPSTGSLDRVIIEDMTFTLRSGSTSGGAIRAKSNSYHSGWELRRLYGDGVSGSADPILDLHGYIGSYVSNVQAQNGQIGICVGTSGFPSNALSLRDCRASACSVAGFLLSGGGQHALVNSTIENCTGYGVKIDGCTTPVIDTCWFENQLGADVYVTGTASHARILHSKFHYHQGGSTAPHIHLVGPSSPAALYGVEIASNHFQDASGGGQDVIIDANCAGTMVNHNHLYGLTTITDSGTGTQRQGNGINDDHADNVLPGFIVAGSRPYYGTERGTVRLKKLTSQTSDLLTAYDTDGSTVLSRLNKDGYMMTKKTAAPDTGDLAAGECAFWYDSTNGAAKLMIKARTANGTTVTGSVTLA